MVRQNFIGVVVSQGKMNKTVKVRVEQQKFNKLINKHLVSRKDYLVHDETNVTREGDLVRIEATRPLSAHKYFAIAQVLKNKGQQFKQFEKDAKIQVNQEEAAKAMDFMSRQKQETFNLQNKSGLLNDLLFLDKLAGSSQDKIIPEDLQKASKLKAKYNLGNWPPEGKVFDSFEISDLRAKLVDIKSKIDKSDKFLETLNSVMQDKEKVSQIISSMGKDVSSIKPSICKNLIRKYLSENRESL